MVDEQQVVKEFNQVKDALGENINVELSVESSANFPNNVKAVCSKKQNGFTVRVCKDYVEPEELKGVIAHEFCHALERQYGNPIIGTDDLKEAYDIAAKTKNRQLAGKVQELRRYYMILNNLWTRESVVNKAIAQIDEILKAAEDLKEEHPEYKEMWKWFSENFDKLYDAIDYYECGGHNTEWFEWKESCEDVLGIEIPIVEAVN